VLSSNKVSFQERTIKKRLAAIIIGLILLIGGFITLFVYRKSTRLPLPTPPTPQISKLAEYHSVGGFAGFRDHLVIYSNGTASNLDDVTGKQKDFQVETELFNQLKEFTTKLGKFTYEDKGFPGGADNLYTKIILYGQAANEKQPTEEEQITIQRTLLSILNQGRI